MYSLLRYVQETACSASYGGNKTSARSQGARRPSIGKRTLNPTTHNQRSASITRINIATKMKGPIMLSTGLRERERPKYSIYLVLFSATSTLK